MKKLGMIFIAALVIALLIFIVVMFWMGARNEPESTVYIDNIVHGRIWDIFLKNGDLYCINGLGELYIRENSNGGGSRMDIISSYERNIYVRKVPSDKLVHTFPTSEVHWSDKYRTFLYYDKGAIFSYDPSKDITKELFQVKWEYEFWNRYHIKDNMFDSIDKYAFLSLDCKSYRIDLETGDVLTLLEFVDYTIAKNNDIILYKVFDDNTIMCHELSTNKEYKLNSRYFYNKTDLSIDIKSAFMVDDVLYFTKSDGQIYAVQINNGEVKNIEAFPKDSDITKKKVVGIERGEENFICVFLNFNKENGVKTLSVCELYSDGTYEIIRTDEIYYGSLDITCKVIVQRQRYAYLVKTDDLAVTGWTFDRFDIHNK
jgi:outer membrane protein assembly factor BamB